MSYNLFDIVIALTYQHFNVVDVGSLTILRDSGTIQWSYTNWKNSNVIPWKYFLLNPWVNLVMLCYVLILIIIWSLFMCKVIICKVTSRSSTDQKCKHLTFLLK